MSEDIFEISIPWKTIAASPDMMDVTFNNRRFPYAWRSSLAFSVYEPPRNDSSPNPCGQRIAFVKVTCSLTGYQTAGSETDTITFGNEPLEEPLRELERLTTEYLGCYGALLNVAVFPPNGPVSIFGATPDLSTYPHILDFTPKTRELIRSVTEGGELLTGSTRTVRVDQSLTTTTKNESSASIEAGVESESAENRSGGAEVEGNVTGKISHTWGTQRGLKIDSVDSQINKQTHVTSMDQLYSLLTGYHSGTNRATFIMLARPGTLQPTNRRTFASGLRMLEGVQDFIMVVARPEEQEELCIEANLNTGHFPEAVELVGGEDSVERRTFPHRVRATIPGGWWSSENGESVEFGTLDRPNDRFTVPSDGGGQWIIDVDADGSDNGVSLGEDRTETDPDLEDGILFNSSTLRVERVDDGTAIARGKIVARGGDAASDGPTTIVDKTFNIHVRRPRVSTVAPSADPAQMLVTNRGLSVCYKTVDGCPQVVDPSQVPGFDPTPDERGIEWIDDARMPPLRTSISLDTTYSAIRSGLISSAAAGARGGSKSVFADTDYFSQKIARGIPLNIAKMPVVEVVDLHACSVSKKQLGTTTVRQLLSANLRQYVRSLDLKKAEALELRRAVLRYVEAQLEGKVVEK